MPCACASPPPPPPPGAARADSTRVSCVPRAVFPLPAALRSGITCKAPERSRRWGEWHWRHGGTAPPGGALAAGTWPGGLARGDASVHPLGRGPRQTPLQAGTPRGLRMTWDAPVQLSSSAQLPREPLFGNFTALGHAVGPGGATHGPHCRSSHSSPPSIESRSKLCRLSPALPPAPLDVFRVQVPHHLQIPPLRIQVGVCPPCLPPMQTLLFGEWAGFLAAILVGGGCTVTKDHNSVAYSLPFLEP